MTVFREVARLSARSRKAFDADDIAGDVALALAKRPADIMAAYPDPVGYARQRASHAGISFDRRERAQRGEGVRLLVGSDGLRHPGRRYISANAADGGDLLAEVVDGALDVDTAVAERMVASAMLREVRDDLTAAEFRELWLVDGCSHSVQEVAAVVGQRRETVSRRLNHTRSQVRLKALLTSM
ncbi:MAG TPA: hypothetical protein PK020_20595 [Ilumatobacteraceae bacterium]|nr:hypothetical protein [Ilumatobacteraceae bacterium]